MAKKSKKLFEDDIDLEEESSGAFLVNSADSDYSQIQEEIKKDSDIDLKTISSEIEKKEVKKTHYKKSKKSKNKLISDSDGKEEVKLDEDDDEYEKEEDLSLLTPYEKFLRVIESKLARVSDGEIAEIITFDRNMEPMLKYEKSTLILRQMNYLRPGDIILHVNRYGKYSVRRVIKIKDDEIYVLGDKENRYTLISKNDILAKVVAKIDGTKYYSFTLKRQSKKLASYKIKSAPVRTMGRIVAATDEDLMYLQEQEMIKLKAEEKARSEFEALKVQSDKMTSLNSSEISSFATKVDDAEGLSAEFNANTSIAKDVSSNDSSEIAGFQTNDVVSGGESLSFENDKRDDSISKKDKKTDIDLSFYIDKKKKGKAAKIKGTPVPPAADFEIKQTKDTFFSTSTTIEDDVIFGNKIEEEKTESIYKNVIKTDVAPEINKEPEVIKFDDDLPPIDFTK